MAILLKIYIISMCIVGTLTTLWFLFGILYLIINHIKTEKATKKQMDDFKEAIAKSGMGKDLNRPLTKDEKELLKKTGHLEFTETLDMETLNVTKETKDGNKKQ